MDDQKRMYEEILSQIAAGQGTLRDQGKVLMELCGHFPDEDKLPALRAYLDVLLRESINVVTSRVFISDFVNAVVSFSQNVQKQIIPYALEKMQPRMASFEEQIFSLRMQLADTLQAEHDFAGAARILSGIPMDGGQRQHTPEFKLDLNLRIVQLYLEADEFVEADNWLQRIGMLDMRSVKESLQLRHIACFARVQDFRRKYVEAAQKYYELSRRPSVADDERKGALLNAVNCVLLSTASQQRDRLMATLAKDERIHEVESYFFFRKIIENRTVKSAEVERFAAVLHPHQRDARNADGSLLLERIVIEHNILCSKKYFRVASFEALSRLLEMPAAKVEKILVGMAAEGRLKIKINHMTNSVTFEGEHPINAWDKKIEQICTQVNHVAEMISAQHPEWYQANCPTASSQ